MKHKQQKSKRWKQLSGLLLVCLLGSFGFTLSTAAQTEQNPTPIMIQLTPDATATMAATAAPIATETLLPTPTPSFAPDRFEPNDSAENATSIGAQTEQGLTLLDADVDYFKGQLTEGQSVQIKAVGRAGLLLSTTLFWQGNRVGDTQYVASVSGQFVLQIQKLSDGAGRYDLTLVITNPTETPTATLSPTSTPTQLATATKMAVAVATATDIAVPTQLSQPVPTATWVPPTMTKVWPTHTPTQIWSTATPSHPMATIVWPTQTPTLLATSVATILPPTATQIWPTQTPTAVATAQLVWPTATPPSPAKPVAQIASSDPTQPASVLAVAAVSAETAPITPTVALTATASLTTAIVTTPQLIPLTVRHLGRAETAIDLATPVPATTVRILVYYDANNDRAPSPNEGIPNVSVLAVDGRGQQLARIFTNAQGEAVLILTGSSTARIIVPFVPNWSARIRSNQQNEQIVLGLPAVRLPVFLPIQNSPAVSEE